MTHKKGGLEDIFIELSETAGADPNPGDDAVAEEIEAESAPITPMEGIPVESEEAEE